MEDVTYFLAGGISHAGGVTDRWGISAQNPRVLQVQPQWMKNAEMLSLRCHAAFEHPQQRAQNTDGPQGGPARPP